LVGYITNALRRWICNVRSLIRLSLSFILKQACIGPAVASPVVWMQLTYHKLSKINDFAGCPAAESASFPEETHAATALPDLPAVEQRIGRTITL
jgi:hypothetical protein